MGYGKQYTAEEIKKQIHEQKASYMDIVLLKAKTNYIMDNPADFLKIILTYDHQGIFLSSDEKEILPDNINSKCKIIVRITDNRGAVPLTSIRALANFFVPHFLAVCRYISVLGDIDTDVIGIFCNKEDIPLGYFYKGEYHFLKDYLED